MKIKSFKEELEEKFGKELITIREELKIKLNEVDLEIDRRVREE